MKKLFAALFLAGFTLSLLGQGVKQSGWTTTTNPATARSALGANNATNLDSGTLPDARLSTNIPLYSAGIPGGAIVGTVATASTATSLAVLGVPVIYPAITNRSTNIVITANTNLVYFNQDGTNVLGYGANLIFTWSSAAGAYTNGQGMGYFYCGDHVAVTNAAHSDCGGGDPLAFPTSPTNSFITADWSDANYADFPSVATSFGTNAPVTNVVVTVTYSVGSSSGTNPKTNTALSFPLQYVTGNDGTISNYTDAYFLIPPAVQTGLSNQYYLSTNAAFLIPSGNDATATFGNPALPSATFTNALRLITNGGAIWLLGSGQVNNVFGQVLITKDITIVMGNNAIEWGGSSSYADYLQVYSNLVVWGGQFDWPLATETTNSSVGLNYVHFYSPGAINIDCFDLNDGGKVKIYRCYLWSTWDAIQTVHVTQSATFYIEDSLLVCDASSNPGYNTRCLPLMNSGGSKATAYVKDSTLVAVGSATLNAPVIVGGFSQVTPPSANCVVLDNARLIAGYSSPNVSTNIIVYGTNATVILENMLTPPANTMNISPGAVLTSLPTGSYFGTFTGSGSGLTNLNAASVSGTFTGNGGGLTNISSDHRKINVLYLNGGAVSHTAANPPGSSTVWQRGYVYIPASTTMSNYFTLPADDFAADALTNSTLTNLTVVMRGWVSNACTIPMATELNLATNTGPMGCYFASNGFSVVAANGSNYFGTATTFAVPYGILTNAVEADVIIVNLGTGGTNTFWNTELKIKN
jgi:hypothetical protein